MLAPEELRHEVQRLILPPPSPFEDVMKKWRRPAADCAPLAKLYADHKGEVAESLFGQVATGNLFAPKPGTLELHDAANDWNPFFAAANPSRSQRIGVARRLEACVLQPRLPYEFQPVGRGKNARTIVAQRFLKLPGDLAALQALIQCGEKWDVTGERAALAPFILRHGFTDPDCREYFDDLLDFGGVPADQREKFFTDHADDRDAAFDAFVAMKFQNARGGQRWPLFRGFPKKQRKALEGRQVELIEIERRRAGIGFPRIPIRG